MKIAFELFLAYVVCFAAICLFMTIGKKTEPRP